MTPNSKQAPILRYTGRIVRGLKMVAERDDPVLTVSMLIDVMGRRAHRLLILVLTLLNMLPGPPGFGGTIAWTTLAVALAMVLGRPIWVPGIIGRRRLPLKLLLKGSELVDRVTAVVARLSRPRLRWLTGGMMTVPYGLFAMFISVAMTVPIPFINAVPNVGLCVLAFSMLNRDGVGAVLGTLICLAGLVIEALLIFGVVQLGMSAVDAIM